MSGHRVLQDMNLAPFECLDPGNAGIIQVDRWNLHVPLRSAGAETRTLPTPAKAGLRVVLEHAIDAGDITVTVTGGYNENGDTTLVFSDPGQVAILESIRATATAFLWRIVAHEGVVGPTMSAVDAAALAEVVTATNVIAANENGKTFYVSAAAGFLSTLPAPFLGGDLTFVVKTAPTSVGYTIATNASANIIKGMVVERAGGAGVASAVGDLVTLVANQSIAGDWLRFKSDGTSWFIHGMVDVAAGVTIGST